MKQFKKEKLSHLVFDELEHAHREIKQLVVDLRIKMKNYYIVFEWQGTENNGNSKDKALKYYLLVFFMDYYTIL